MAPFHAILQSDDVVGLLQFITEQPLYWDQSSTTGIIALRHPPRLASLIFIAVYASVR